MEVSAKLRRKLYRVESYKKVSVLVSIQNPHLTAIVKEELKPGVTVLYDSTLKRLLTKTQQNVFRKAYEIEKQLVELLGEDQYAKLDEAIEQELLLSDYLLNKNFSILQEKGLTQAQLAKIEEHFDKAEAPKKHYFQLISLESLFMTYLREQPLAEKIYRKDHRYVVTCLKAEFQNLLKCLELIPKTYVKKISKEVFDEIRN